jgi:PhoPQ-activated pathogenicity-related protein
MNSAGDQFFLPDSWQFYFDDLLGTKYLRYVPNTDHGLDDSDAAECMMAFYNAILTGARLPEFSWKVRDDGAIEVKTVDVPLTVKVWQAANPEARDFRKERIGKAWSSMDLEVNASGAYVARVSAPEAGWTAFMVELTYESGLPVPLTFTTGVHVVPETLPFAYEPPLR